MSTLSFRDIVQFKSELFMGSRMKKTLAIAATLAAVSSAALADSPDLTHGHTLYMVGYTHLDTQWCWDYRQVIEEFIPNTMRGNFALLDNYPHFIFNFSGANRYRMMKEYYPADFQRLKSYVEARRWFPAGSSWEESDTNIPSSESLVRQVLYGNLFFERELGQTSNEFMLPDCFGFPASLPTILAHCGVKGFSTQKLTWGSAVGIPFNVGKWEGPDGNYVLAALNAMSYETKIKADLSCNDKWLSRIDQDGNKYGVYADYSYFGEGDRGGPVPEESVKWLEKSISGYGPLRVISATADQMFNDLSKTETSRLPVYKGDLLLTAHSAGSISSQAYMKRWNRRNEALAYAVHSGGLAGQSALPA